MRKLSYSFLKIGLASNPFRALTREEWAKIVVLPKPLEGIFSSGIEHLQLLGPMGSGKTSVLLKLAERYEQAGKKVAHEYIAEDQSHYHTKTTGLDVFFLDEAQRLNWWHRRRLLASIGKITTTPLRVVLSSHQNLASLFERQGFPITTLNLRDIVSEEHYKQVLARRLSYFAVPGIEYPSFSPEAIRYLYVLFGENMREAEYFLYEVFQRLDDVEIISSDKLVSVKLELDQ